MNSTPLVGSSQQIGLAVAAAMAPGTFARSLSKRSYVDQGVITGLSVTATYLLTVVAQDGLAYVGTVVAPRLPLPPSASEESRRDLGVVVVDLAAATIGLAATARLRTTDEESTQQGWARQAAWRFGVTGLGASILVGATAGAASLDRRLGLGSRLSRVPLAIPAGLIAAAVMERARQAEHANEPDPGPMGANPLLGTAAATGIVTVLGAIAVGESKAAHAFSTMAARRLPGHELFWQLVGHTAILATFAAGIRVLWSEGVRRIEAGTSTFAEGLEGPEAQQYTGPTISGNEESLVGWDTIGREGRRHALAFVRPEPVPTAERPAGVGDMELSIQTVMGEPAAATPIQVYIGLDSAPTRRERVALAMAELDRTHAWDRSLLMLVSPTGTGYVNYCAIASAQYFTRGDMASVTLQYSKRPSPLSLGKVRGAREQNRLLWLSILRRVRDLPPEQRPKVVLFGESLGAWTSQDALLGWGTLAPQALGIDRALWIGTPHGSEWAQEVTVTPGEDVDPELVTVVNDFGQIEDMDPQRRSALRYVLLSHDNDGVTKFGISLFAHRPSWLRPDRPPLQEVAGSSPRGIPASMRWRPITTFFQTFVDMKNAQIPGSFQAWAHDYRPDLPLFIREVFDLDATDEQVAAVRQAVQERELVREAVFD